MDADDLILIVIRYASALCEKVDGDANAHAVRLGWLDRELKLTALGKELAEALLEQTGTRSSFRIG